MPDPLTPLLSRRMKLLCVALLIAGAAVGADHPGWAWAV